MVEYGGIWWNMVEYGGISIKNYTYTYIGKRIYDGK